MVVKNSQEYVKDLLDTRSAFEKAKDGDFGKLNSADFAGAAGVTNSFIGMNDKLSKIGVAPKILPKLPFVGIPIAAWGASAEGDRHAERIAYWFADGNMRQLQYDHTYNKAIKAAENAGYEGAKAAAWGLGGGLGGAALVGLITLNPIGAVAGAIAGGWAASSFHESVVKDNIQDPVSIAMQAAKMQEAKIQSAGKDVPDVPEVVIFSALAANLQGSAAKRADRLLEILTGEKTWAAALANPENMAKLDSMRHDTMIADAIRAQTGMPLNPQNMFEGVETQYAQLINSGQMSAKNLLDSGAGMMAMSMAQKGIPNPEMMVHNQLQANLPHKQQSQMASAGVTS